MSFRSTPIMIAATVAVLAGTLGSAPARSAAKQVVNPYAGVEWEKVEFLHSFSHQHGTDPQVFWDMGFGHLPLSNYYPSRPFYPLPAKFLQRHPEALGAPNAEQHSTTDAGVHFNALGSFYTVGYGQTPRIKPGTAPVEHVFSKLNVFDAERSPWLGVYRLDLEFARRARADGEPAISLTVDGAIEVSHKTFATVGDGIVRARHLGANWRGSIYLKTRSDTMRVRLDFDPASTQITRFRLMQGTNRPWRDAFRAALDGALKDGAGRPVEGLLYPDGGGITINHPRGSLPPLLDMLDFDPRVLGIEVWNQHTAFGGTSMLYYQRWDEILRTGRQCYGFFVKDHVVRARGRNVLLVSSPPGATRQQREHEALRAYREGRFFGLLGAAAVDGAGNPTPPYDKSDFRFARIALRENAAGEPIGLEVALTGADRSRRPNTQIRFITDAGLTHVANAERACFEFPRGPAGAIGCRYVRVEALAYPDTHLGGQRLTADALAAMNVHEIARIHDRLGPSDMSKIDAGQSPIPIVDMLFSQPILLGAAR